MIKVNGKEFDATAVFAEDGSMSMTFATTEKLSKIEGYFPESVTIEVIENGEVTAKYYNKAVLSLKVMNGIERTVNAILRVTALQESAEDALNGRVDTSDGAIEELAGMAADHEARIAALEEQIAALIPASETGEDEDAAESTAETDEDAAESAAETDENAAESAAETDENAAETQQGISSETGAESTENENVSSEISESGTEASNG